MNSKDVPGSFQTTRWSVVLRTVGADDVQAMDALAVLCDAYWYPLYIYFRRCGKGPHDAEDLTQGFFARLLSKEILAGVHPSKVKLRTFLLTCAQNFLADEYDRAVAEKRGAGMLNKFDGTRAEERYAAEPVDDLSPDRLFQRRWALTILERSLQILREEFRAENKEDVFEALRPFLGFAPDPEQSYEEIAARLRIPIGSLKNQVFRLRRRWRERLFEQVGMTLENPSQEDIRDELKELLACV